MGHRERAPKKIESTMRRAAVVEVAVVKVAVMVMVVVVCGGDGIA